MRRNIKKAQKEKNSMASIITQNVKISFPNERAAGYARCNLKLPPLSQYQKILLNLTTHNEVGKFS